MKHVIQEQEGEDNHQARLNLELEGLKHVIQEQEGEITTRAALNAELELEGLQHVIQGRRRIITRGMLNMDLRGIYCPWHPAFSHVKGK